MKAAILDSRYEEAYERFLLRQDNALFYHSLKYRNFIKDLIGCYDHYLIAIEKDTIHGVMPIMRRGGKYGDVFNSLPFFGSTGGIIAEREEAVLILINEYNSIVSGAGVAASTVIMEPIAGHCPKYTAVIGRTGHFSEITCSGNPEAYVMSMVEPSLRRDINKAARCGITIVRDASQLDLFADMYYDNMKIIGGKTRPDRFFGLMRKHFTVDTDYCLYMAMFEGRAIAGLLLFYYNKTAVYYIPAFIRAFGTLQPLKLAIYRAMIDSFNRGCTSWDWGITLPGRDGVLKFKKKWGAVERQYFFYCYVANEHIYNASERELREAYGDYFYTIPFDMLNAGKNDG
ncbi:MAG: GNAT family N-acetyltransferase [Nitrospirae bacterium]|nr:GNAT family N-acetyltransferase [Nitrospirota bacterium]